MGHVEAIGLSTFAQEVLIALSSSAKPVIVADDDGGAPQALNQHVPHKFGGAQTGKGPVKGLDDEVVQAGVRQGGGTLVHGLQEFEPAVLAEEHLPRVGVEGQDHGFRISDSCLVHHPLQQGLMAEVHPVKGAGGDDAPDAGREVGKSVVNLHWNQK